MSRELLQQALNALRISAPLGHAMEDYEYRHKVIKDIEAELAKPDRWGDSAISDPVFLKSQRDINGAIRQLAKPEQEPLKCTCGYSIGHPLVSSCSCKPRKPWQGLTDEQLSETYNDLYTQYTRDDVNIVDFILIARTIELLLKEKNNAV